MKSIVWHAEVVPFDMTMLALQDSLSMRHEVTPQHLGQHCP